MIGKKKGRVSVRENSQAGGAADAAERATIEILRILAEGRASQEELAIEIGSVIRQAAEIETALAVTKEKIEGFDEGFSANHDAVENIRSKIGGLDDGAASLAAAAQQAASATEEISASIDRISSESSSRYEEVKDLADMSRKGQTEMAETLKGIREVAASIDTLKGFISAINDIAERTSLLAMNASIEAAHAGASGKGFAVIAGEVRQLAASAGENAGAISARLNALIASIKKAEDTSGSTARIFGVVEERVQRATDSFFEICRGTEELAVGGREIRESMGSLRTISTEIKDSSSKLREVAAALESQTEQLKSESAATVASLSEIRNTATEMNHSVLRSALSTVAEFRSGEKAVAAASGSVVPDKTQLFPLLSLQHLTWVARARAVLDGKIELDAATMGDHHGCDLGHWMDSEGRAILSQSSWNEMDTQHTALHRTAKDVIQKANSGQTFEAESVFMNLLEISQKMVTLLRRTFVQAEPDNAILHERPSRVLGSTGKIPPILTPTTTTTTTT